MASGKRFRRLAGWALAAAMLAIVLWGVERAGTALVISRDVGPPDAIVMLASHELERLPVAAALARQYTNATVLLTVPTVISEYNCTRCSERVNWLETEGVSEARVRVLAPHVKNTHDEALAVLAYEQAHPFQRLVVVSSPYHARRALATFERAFAGTAVQVGFVPASSTSPARPSRWLWHHYDRAYVAYEWAAILDYRFRYGVPMW